MKRKVGGKILLCLIMCLTLIGSSLTVFATADSEDNVTSSEPITTGLDLSKFEDGDIKNYVGVHYNDVISIDYVILDSQYPYYFLFTDDSKYYLCSVEYDDDSAKTVFNEISVDTLNSDIYNKDKYVTYPETQTGFYTLGSVEDQDAGSPYSFYIFVYDNGFKNLGKYSSFSSIKDVSVIDSLITDPVVDVSLVDESSESATIRVNYSAGTRDLVDLTCSNENGVLFIKTLDNPEQGTVDFKVTSNGTYKIGAYYATYLTDDADHFEKSIDVNCISEVEVEEDDSETEDVVLDEESPTITFSSLPDSAPSDTSVELTMYSDEPAILNFNGVSSNDYVTEMKVSLSCNGDYFYSAGDERGNTVEDTLNIDFFKDNNIIDDSNRDSFWGETVAESLPKTGGTGFKTFVVIGVILVGSGIFFIIRSMKKKSKLRF